MFNKTSEIVRIVALGALLAMVVLAPVGLPATRVEATVTPFLKRPFYGAARSWNAVFDHELPIYTTDGYVLRYDGSPPVPTCPSGVVGSTCYDGHSGYDFPLTYEPVVASYPGTVVYSGWASPNHETSYGLEMEIDHGNGYHTLYGHLSMIRYNVGAQVGYYQIATSGTTGNSTGPHLHFEVQRQNSYGNWVPTDPYGWLGMDSDPWAVRNDGVASDWLWADDREQTPPTYSGDYYFDNDTGNFQMGCDAGTCPYWWFVSTAQGYYGDLRYTLPNGVTPDYWARWNAPSLPDAGQYEVEVYVPYWDASNRSQAVRYELMRQEGVPYVVVVDQHAVGKSDGVGHWISLGRYNFAPATAYVKVTDAAFVGADAQHASYVDPQDSYHKILVDAVRWRKTH